MGIVELAERKGRLRAVIFYLLALCLLAALLISFNTSSGFGESAWVAFATAASMNLAPLGQWLKPNSPVVRLLYDETVKEHRRMSSAAGFWAAIIAALALVSIDDDAATIVSSYDTARVIATAGIVAALVSFATLELRAAR